MTQPFREKEKIPARYQVGSSSGYHLELWQAKHNKIKKGNR